MGWSTGTLVCANLKRRVMGFQLSLVGWLHGVCSMILTVLCVEQQQWISVERTLLGRVTRITSMGSMCTPSTPKMEVSLVEENLIQTLLWVFELSKNKCYIIYTIGLCVTPKSCRIKCLSISVVDFQRTICEEVVVYDNKWIFCLYYPSLYIALDNFQQCKYFLYQEKSLWWCS